MIKIMNYESVSSDEIFSRVEIRTDMISDAVSAILENVKLNGDKAVLEYTKNFDKADLTCLKVSDEEIQEGIELTDKKLVEVLNTAASNIRKFHEKQVRTGFIINDSEGILMGQKIIPIENVGVYVPGGTAAYPSTVLMDTIPAKIAGCKKVVMVTPPNKDGKIAPAILCAASIAGVDEIFKVGGAQAVAALAYGTDSIPKVDKIVGPGNAYVTEAKKQVFGKVAIDMIAGPSEILVIADNTMDPANCAADLLSQAEHDKMASAVLVTDSESFAESVRDQIEIQIEKLERKEIARASIDNNGKIIVAPDIKTAVKISNEIAPEHLEICVDNPFDYLDLVNHAGSVFLGKNCPEALGDYLAGPNHTLPTNGTARFSSPLSVDDFIKKTQYTYFTNEALSKVSDDIALFANTEGLTGHAKSATIRFEVK